MHVDEKEVAAVVDQWHEELVADARLELVAAATASRRLRLSAIRHGGR